MITGKDICNSALISIGDEVIPASEPDAPESFTGSEPRVQSCKSLYPLHRDALLEHFPWRFAARNYYIDYEDQIYTITGATQADPVVVTVAAHPFTVGKYVHISDVEGMTELNGETVRISAVAAGSVTLGEVDGSAYTAYTSGGKIRLRPPFKYEYEFILPSDFLTDRGLFDSESEYEIKDGCLLVDDDEINLEYIAKVTDPAKFSPLFSQALAQYMAAVLGRKIADSRKWADFAMKEFRSTINEARQRNAFLGKPTHKRKETDWETAGRA